MQNMYIRVFIGNIAFIFDSKEYTSFFWAFIFKEIESKFAKKVIYWIWQYVIGP
jgi:hypothetical protein